MWMKPLRTALLVVIALTIVPRPAAAQTTPAFVLNPSEPAAASKDGKVLHALRITGDPPRIDGLLNDEVWTAAETTGDLVQWDPDNMQPMTERTFVQVAYDNRFIYVAVRCDDRTPDLIAAGLGRRDEPPPTDGIGIGFDPRHDHLTGYVFNTNPSAVQQDFYFYDDENADRDFNAVWEVRTSINASGWTAEFRIPFSQMRFPSSPEAGQVWGFGVRRNIRRRGEAGQWTSKPRGERGEVSRWGHLLFDSAIQPPRRIEWLPYALSGATHDSSGATSATARAGLDARVGLGTGATLSATVNPDFAQVEQDPAVLNLTVFETFFPEKRTFFLEDSRTFVPPYGLFQLFHSRRIGDAPDRVPIDADDTLIDRPDQTTIIGAAKVTGKGSGWTYGALTALTDRAHAKVLSSDHVEEERVIEPLTSFNVARIQRDIRQGTSNIGAIGTATVRQGDTNAYTGGVDYNLRWDRNRVNWNGHWVGTHTLVGDALRSGGGGVTNFNFSRKHGGFFTHFDHFSRSFRVDDLGFFRSRPDRSELDGGFRVEQPDPWKMFRSISGFLSAGQAWNGEPMVFSQWVNPDVEMQFLNFSNLEVGFQRNFQVLDDLDTRGGPPIVIPANTQLFAFYNTDTRKPWRFSFSTSSMRDEVGGWMVRVGPGLTLQPSGRLQAAISTNLTAAKDSAQWIRNEDVDGDGITDYIYGTLNRRIIDVTFRSTYAIERDLTLQVYLQPFVAVGDYFDTRKLAKPRSYQFEPVTLADNPDFNSKSLRGNVVLRWEYIRGSTLYVAWNLSTLDQTRAGIFNPLRDLGDTFRGGGTHALLVKVSYWLSR